MTAPRVGPELEWRIVWARQGWERNRAHARGDRWAARHFTRRADALAFAARLTNYTRPGLTPLRTLRIESRPVGPWTPHPTPDTQAHP